MEWARERRGKPSNEEVKRRKRMEWEVEEEMRRERREDSLRRYLHSLIHLYCQSRMSTWERENGYIQIEWGRDHPRACPISPSLSHSSSATENLISIYTSDDCRVSYHILSITDSRKRRMTLLHSLFLFFSQLSIQWKLERSTLIGWLHGNRNNGIAVLFRSIEAEVTRREEMERLRMRDAILSSYIKASIVIGEGRR